MKGPEEWEVPRTDTKSPKLESHEHEFIEGWVKGKHFFWRTCHCGFTESRPRTPEKCEHDYSSGWLGRPGSSIVRRRCKICGRIEQRAVQ